MDAYTTSSAVMIIKIIVTPPRALERSVWVEKPELFMKCVRVELRPISDVLISLFAAERVMPR